LNNPESPNGHPLGLFVCKIKSGGCCSSHRLIAFYFPSDDTCFYINLPTSQFINQTESGASGGTINACIPSHLRYCGAVVSTTKTIYGVNATVQKINPATACKLNFLIFNMNLLVNVWNKLLCSFYISSTKRQWLPHSATHYFFPDEKTIPPPPFASTLRFFETSCTNSAIFSPTILQFISTGILISIVASHSLGVTL